MNSVPNRITGTEMEWAISVPNPNDHAHFMQFETPALTHHLRTYADSHASTGTGNNVFLGNGGRYYIDYQNHVEFASPEDDSFLGTTANEIAGERIVTETYTQPYRDDEGNFQMTHGLMINKRLISDNNETWGCHENYLSTVESGMEIDRDKLALLGMHLVTRNIFLGAGVLRYNGQYCLAQKATGLTKDFDFGTTSNNKPVVNLRNHPEANAEKWLRVHVTSGDATMSPWATRMKLGTTSLVLRLLENGDTLPALRFKEPTHIVARRVAHDVDLKNCYELNIGEHASALAVQKRIIQAVGKLAVTLPAEEQWALEEWRHACFDLERDPSLLQDRSDWVLKKKVLEQAQARHGLSWNSKQLQGIERRWDRIDVKGIGQHMRESTFSKWMPPENLIVDRMHYPPVFTRARVRGQFVHAFSHTKGVITTWDSLRHPFRDIKIDNPYENQNEAVDALIKLAA